MPTYSVAATAPLSAILIVVLILAVWFDVSERRIPNWITAGGLIVSLVARGLVGPEDLWTGIFGGALGLSLGLALFNAGAMGAGDGKLLASVGAILGFEVFIRCLPLIAVFGGLLALVATLRNGTLIATALRFRELVFYCLSLGRIGERRTLSTPGAVSVPYGVAVAAGAVTAWLGWGLTP